MRSSLVRLWKGCTLSVVALFCFGPKTTEAQLWDVPPLPPVKVIPATDGLTATIGNESMHISVCRSSVIHFVATPEAPDVAVRNQPWMLESKESCPGAKFQVSQASDVAVLTTDMVKVELSLKWGNVQYSIANGEGLLRERNSIPRTYEPVDLNGEKTFHVEDRFAPDFSEGFYGLGQHQSGLFNYRGATVELGQNNTDVAIPLLLSTKGYALMWNTASLTHFDNRFPLELNPSSLAGHSVDYYFIYGPEMDQIIHEYRNLTGHTPMLPGATVWSGDVYGSYWGLRHQVAAGLNFALSGYPYWTTDIGGYWPPHDNPLADASFKELYARWFEYGVFCPIFRTHGHRPANELWAFDKVEPILIAYDKLRYRLMPYIYSLAWRVTNDDYTIQRPLVMDWRMDPNVRDIGDEFMFGPFMLVSPVLKADASRRTVYLPESPAWYDFWTGSSQKGGVDVDANAPLDRIPLYVRAGAILPMGHEIEYANEKPDGVGRA